jgi:UDP-N-acetylglucosamine/UDP-N-acetylgalactosamine 4-epimerase
MFNVISNKRILITGGAGFIGSNLVDYMLELNNKVICLDNFSTGKRENLLLAQQNPNFTLIEGDIRNYDDCIKAVKGCDFVLHEAALGSVPRSISDPMTTTDVNIGGFVKMLFAAKEEKVKRFIYAASSSTYGDHPDLPKVEDKIGNALSPYAITKYVDELFAKNFTQIYGIDTIGLRYFNVFGRRQDPNGAYAAVIPLWVKSFINHQPPVINGDGEFSRDFTYIDNVIQMNLLAMVTEKPEALNEVYNTAYGDRTTLNQLIGYLKEFLSEYDPEIKNVEIIHGPNREGDVPHSLASIEKAEQLLNYNPKYNLRDGLYEAVKWYWENLK